MSRLSMCGALPPLPINYFLAPGQYYFIFTRAYKYIYLKIYMLTERNLKALCFFISGLHCKLYGTS
jgi:hypothetical protein